jgi:acyl-CoA thioester hydrolase
VARDYEIGMERYARSFTVRWADCDVNGHMRNTAYSEYAIEVRVGYLADHGFPFERFVELGFGPVILREEIDYLREVRLGETVEVDVTVLGLSPDFAKFRFAHDFTKADGKRSARIVLAGGWLDLRTRKLIPPPEPLAAVMRAFPRGEGYAELPALRRG